MSHLERLLDAIRRGDASPYRLNAVADWHGAMAATAMSGKFQRDYERHTKIADFMRELAVERA